MYLNGYANWIRNIRGFGPQSVTCSNGECPGTYQIWAYQTKNITLRDSFFYGSADTSNNYVLSNFGSADNRFENNIVIHAAFGNIQEGCIGCVDSYNFHVDQYYTGTPAGSATAWQQGSSYHHAVGDAYVLVEGNDQIMLEGDDVHGTSNLFTAFRNYLSGLDPAGGSAFGTSGKQQQTNAVQLASFNRYWNLIGNVVGTPSYHTSAGSNTNGYFCRSDNGACVDQMNNNHGNNQVYCFGYASSQCISAGAACALPQLCDDALTGKSVMLWGNCDTVNNACRFQNSEVPSSLTKYSNQPPASNTLPNSMYLCTDACTTAGEGKPPFWSTPWGQPQWPAIGPDVNCSGSLCISGAQGNHAGHVPAYLALVSLPIDNSFSNQYTISAASASGNIATVTLNSVTGIPSYRHYIRVTGSTNAAYNCSLCVLTNINGNNVSYILPTSNPGTFSGMATLNDPVIVQFDAAVAYTSPNRVTYDNAVSSGFQWGVTSVTTPALTIGSGANRAAMIMVGMTGNNVTGITASLGGVNGTLVSGTDSGTTASIRTLIYCVINPSSGSQMATVSWTGTMNADVGVVTVSGADQTTACNNGTFTATNSAPATTTSVTITSNAGDLTTSIGYTYNQWVSPFTNQTLKWGIDASAVGGDIGPGTGISTHMWTDQYSNQIHSISGANFKASAP